MSFWPVFLLQLVVYVGVMVVDDYAGFLLALIIGAICFSIWAISYAVEWIQPSKVKKSYYHLMLGGWIAPAVALVFFLSLKGGFDWLP